MQRTKRTFEGHKPAPKKARSNIQWKPIVYFAGMKDSDVEQVTVERSIVNGQRAPPPFKHVQRYTKVAKRIRGEMADHWHKGPFVITCSEDCTFLPLNYNASAIGACAGDCGDENMTRISMLDLVHGSMKQADLVVFRVDKETHFGAFVQLGMALAMNKPIVVECIEKRTCMDMFLYAAEASILSLENLDHITRNDIFEWCNSSPVIEFEWVSFDGFVALYKALRDQ